MAIEQIDDKRKLRYVREYFEGSGDVDYQTSTEITGNGSVFRFYEARITLSDVGDSENFRIKLNSSLGNNYNVLIYKSTLAAESSLCYVTESPKLFFPGDKIKITYKNNLGRTYGLEVLYGVL